MEITKICSSKFAIGVSLRHSFINHMEHLNDIIGCYQRCYDVIHMSNNGLTHNNCIVTCLQWKIGLHKADLQETKNSSAQA